MIRWFWHLLHGGEPREFASAFGIEDSVRRLQAATGRSLFSSLTTQMAVGKVSESRVRLQRVIPMVGNGFKPHFVGQFEEIEGRVVLRGQFTMSLYARVFMSIWFGFIALWTVLAFLPFAIMDPYTWWFPFAGVAMFGAGIALVRGGQWFSRNDAAWLSQVIERALSPDQPPGGLLQGDTRPVARAGS